jgi:hypothetical protein
MPTVNALLRLTEVLGIKLEDIIGQARGQALKPK